MKRIINSVLYWLDTSLRTATIVEVRYQCPEVYEVPSKVVYKDKEYTVTRIAALAYREQRQMKSLFLPRTIKYIERSAFIYCRNLVAIEVDKSNYFYDSRNECNAIIDKESNRLMLGCKNTQIPESIITISNFAFAGCHELESIHIPPSVVRICHAAFEECISLTSIQLPPKMQLVDTFCFSECNSLRQIRFPEGIERIDEFAFAGCSALETIEWASTIKSIGNSAFEDCTSLTELNFPDSVTEIADWAFHRCTSVRKITLPSALTTLSFAVFLNCQSLTEITIPGTIKSIKCSAFGDCNSLEKVRILEGVECIEQFAFDSPQCVMLPSTIKVLDSSAFSKLDVPNFYVPKGMKDTYQKMGLRGYLKDTIYEIQ